MNKNRKLGCRLQLFAQTWNPDNVTVFEHKDGTIPEKYTKLILKEIMKNSKVMQLAKYEEMDSKEKKFEYFAKGPGAYWVGEGEKIKTSKAQWLQVKMVAKKLGVIIPCSREFLHYKMSDFFEVMKPKIAEAFYKKFDKAAILNVENPFLHAVDKSVTEAGNVINGALNYDNILGLEDLLTDEDYDVNAFISTKKNRSTLRNAHKIENGVIVESLYDRSANTLDGNPVVDLKDMDKGTLYAGDFDYMYYGIPYGMNYKISEEAQLSTLTNEDGTPVNLYEQELVALRVTMDVGFMIVKDGAFAKLTSGGLGKLTVTSVPGTKAGDTKITVTPALTSGNSYKYKVGEELDVPVRGQNVKGWTAWNGTSDITAKSGDEIVIVECDDSGQTVNAGKAAVTSAVATGA
ncbi:MAG: phage major capsid protein [Dorea sp.]|nr:phage major capsid protein [Dorea sp.]